MKYEIKGGTFPIVVCHLEDGEQMITEKGAMIWMTPNMQMETVGGGVGKMFSKALSGESMFQNIYTSKGAGMITFGSSFPGRVLPVEIRPGKEFIVQKTAFLASEKGVNLSVHFNKKAGAGFFGGEGFIMQQIKGNGLVFLEIDGYCKEYDLGVGQSIVVDTGYLAAMSESCTMDIETVKGAKNVLFGGEGIFHTRVTGPGKVYIQSMPVINTAERLTPYIKIQTNDNNSGGINIRLGD